MSSKFQNNNKQQRPLSKEPDTEAQLLKPNKRSFSGIPLGLRTKKKFSPKPKKKLQKKSPEAKYLDMQTENGTQQLERTDLLAQFYESKRGSDQISQNGDTEVSNFQKELDNARKYIYDQGIIQSYFPEEIPDTVEFDTWNEKNVEKKLNGKKKRNDRTKTAVEYRQSLAEQKILEREKSLSEIRAIQEKKDVSEKKARQQRNDDLSSAKKMRDEIKAIEAEEELQALKELKAIDELYQPAHEESMLHKTRAQLQDERLQEQLKNDNLVTSLGRIIFELGNLEYYIKKLDLARSYEHFTQRPNGQFDFTNSFLKLKSKKLKYSDYKDMGLPNKNFVITLEFKTKDKDAPLFSVNSPIGEYGHDRHIYLKNGKAVVRISPEPLFTCKNQDLADDKWHLLEVFCLEEQPVRVMIDGTLSGENFEVDRSDFTWATGICIGYCDEIKHKSFTGSIRNLRYEECVLNFNNYPTFQDFYSKIEQHRIDFESEMKALEERRAFERQRNQELEKELRSSKELAKKKIIDDAKAKAEKKAKALMKSEEIKKQAEALQIQNADIEGMEGPVEESDYQADIQVLDEFDNSLERQEMEDEIDAKEAQAKAEEEKALAEAEAKAAEEKALAEAEAKAAEEKALAEAEAKAAEEKALAEAAAKAAEEKALAEAKAAEEMALAEAEAKAAEEKALAEAAANAAEEKALAEAKAAEEKALAEAQAKALAETEAIAKAEQEKAEAEAKAAMEKALTEAKTETKDALVNALNVAKTKALKAAESKAVEQIALQVVISCVENAVDLSIGKALAEAEAKAPFEVAHQVISVSIDRAVDVSIATAQEKAIAQAKAAEILAQSYKKNLEEQKKELEERQRQIQEEAQQKLDLQQKELEEKQKLIDEILANQRTLMEQKDEGFKLLEIPCLTAICKPIRVFSDINYQEYDIESEQIIEKKGPAFSEHINRFITDTKCVEIPSQTAFFKRGKRQWVESTIEVDCEQDEQDEMMLVITTVPAITAVSRTIKVEVRSASVIQNVYESPRKVDLPVISAFQKFIKVNKIGDETFGEPQSVKDLEQNTLIANDFVNELFIEIKKQQQEDILIQDQDQDDLSLYSLQKVNVGTVEPSSVDGEFSLEFQRELFENSVRGNNSNRQSRFDGEMKVKRNPSPMPMRDINVVMEKAILEGFGIEPKLIIKEPLEFSICVLSHDIEADFPKDMSSILVGPKRDFENIQLDNFKNVSSLLINRINQQDEAQEMQNQQIDTALDQMSQANNSQEANNDYEISNVSPSINDQRSEPSVQRDMDDRSNSPHENLEFAGDEEEEESIAMITLSPHNGFTQQQRSFTVNNDDIESGGYQSSQQTLNSNDSVQIERRLLQRQLMKQICYEEKLNFPVDSLDDHMIDKINIVEFASIIEKSIIKNLPNLEDSIMVQLTRSIQRRQEVILIEEQARNNMLSLEVIKSGPISDKSVAHKDFFTQSERSDFKKQLLDEKEEASSEKSEELPEEEVKQDQSQHQQQRRNLEESLKKTKDRSRSQILDEQYQVAERINLEIAKKEEKKDEGSLDALSSLHTEPVSERQEIAVVKKEKSIRDLSSLHTDEESSIMIGQSVPSTDQKIIKRKPQPQLEQNLDTLNDLDHSQQPLIQKTKQVYIQPPSPEIRKPVIDIFKKKDDGFLKQEETKKISDPKKKLDRGMTSFYSEKLDSEDDTIIEQKENPLFKALQGKMKEKVSNAQHECACPQDDGKDVKPVPGEEPPAEDNKKNEDEAEEVLPLSYKQLIKFISQNHPVNPVTKEKFSTDQRITVKNYGMRFLDACGCYTLFLCCKNCCKSYWKLQRGVEEKRVKPEGIKDLPDSGSESSQEEDQVGFGGLTAAGAHLGVGAALYLQTMKTFAMMFFLLSVLNFPIYLLYNNGTEHNDYSSIDRSWHFFGIGNIRGQSIYCNTVPIQFGDEEQLPLKLQCEEEDQYISRIDRYGFMYNFDPRTQAPSSGEYQCGLVTDHIEWTQPITIKLRKTDLTKKGEQNRIIQNNTLYNMDPLCQKNSKILFQKGEEMQDEVSLYNLENCIHKNECEWSPEFIKSFVAETSDKCRQRIVGNYPSEPTFKVSSNEFLIMYNCLSDKIHFPFGNIPLHKEVIGAFAVAVDVIGIFLMIYVVIKLEQINKDFVGIIDNNQITMKDFSIMCRNVQLDKYTQDPILLKMKIWLHFSKQLESYKIEGNNQEIVDVTVSLCNSPQTLWIFKMEATQIKILDIKNKLSAGEFKDAQFFAKQEELEDLNEQFDRLKDKYKQIEEEEKKKKKSVQIIPKCERMSSIDYVFVTFKNVESVENAEQAFEIEPSVSKVFRCIFCIKSKKHMQKEFLKHELDVRQVFEPDEILWESLRTNSDISIKNKLIMWAMSVITIVLTCCIQILIESIKTQYEMDNPPYLCPPKDIDIHKEKAYLDSLTQHPKGLMNCYCLNIIKTAPWKAPFMQFIDVDPHGEDMIYYCRKPMFTLIKVVFLRVFAAISVVLMNGVIASVFKYLSKMQYKHTTIETTQTAFNQIFTMEFFNVSFSLIIASFTGLNKVLIKYEDHQILPSSKYNGFDTNWYRDIGNIICCTVFFSSFISNGIALKSYFKSQFKQLKDRKFASNLKKFPDDEDDDEPNTKKMVQSELEKLYEGRNFECEKSISRMMSTIFVILMFSPGMPILYFLGFIFFFVTYKTNKLLLMRYYKKTDSLLSREIPIFAVYILRYGLIIKLFSGLLMYCNPKLFQVEEHESSLPKGFDIEGFAANNPALASQLEKGEPSDDDTEKYYPIDFVIMIHQQLYIMFIFGLIISKFSWDFTQYFTKIVYSSIQGILWSIYVKIKYIIMFCSALIKAIIKKIKQSIQRFIKKRMSNKQNQEEHVVLTSDPPMDTKNSNKDKKTETESKKSEKSAPNTNSQRDNFPKKTDVPPPPGDLLSINSQGSGNGNALEEAQKQMEAQERAAHIAEILRQRKLRTDYSDNIFRELNMDSLNSIYERSTKEYEDFKAFFNINMATEKHMFNKKSSVPHRLRNEFLELCYLSGVVEDEVMHYDNLLKKRIRDIEEVIEQHFVTIKTTIVEEKEEKRDRDIEKTFKKEDYRQKIDQMIIEQKFNNDPDMKFDDPNIYTYQKKLEQLISHQDALIKIDKERIENRRNIQTICRLQGSQAQSYFFFDNPSYKVAKKIYYQLEYEEQEIRNQAELDNIIDSSDSDTSGDSISYTQSQRLI